MNPNVHKSHTWFESQICFYFNAIPPASLQSSVIGQNKTILSVPPQRTLPWSRFPGSVVPTIHSPQRAERPPSTAFFLFLGLDRDWYVAHSSRLSPQAPQELRQSGGALPLLLLSLPLTGPLTSPSPWSITALHTGHAQAGLG